MSYIGNTPLYGQFPVYNFTGDGSTTNFILPQSSGSTNAMLVIVGDVPQRTDAYQVSGNNLIFNEAVPNTVDIEVRLLAYYVENTGADVTQNRVAYTATQNQDTFVATYSVGNIDVFHNGGKLMPSDFTATNGTNVVFDFPCDAGDTVEFITYNTVAYADVYIKADVYNKVEIDAMATGDINGRNTVLNQEAVTQAESTDTGFSSTIYTGNGASHAINTGIDMSTGDNGGLFWGKSRSSAFSHQLYDTVRGVTKRLAPDVYDAEATVAQGVTAFTSTGVTLGTDGAINTNAGTVVGWTWQTNKKTSGVTNRNKAYTAHYNSDIGFSIVGYTGDGVRGHEIPHHLGVKPELSIFKARNSGSSWHVLSASLFPHEYLSLDTSNAGIDTANTYDYIPDVDTTKLDSTWGGVNPTDAEVISYHFTSVPGVSKIGKYIGNGVSGNYVDCGFGSKKAGWVMVKNLYNAGDWVIMDNMRPSNILYPNLANADEGNVYIYPSQGGFNLAGSVVNINTLNNEYVFLAFAETSIDATKTWTDYSHPTTPDKLDIVQGTLLSYAKGFNAKGAIDNLETVGTSVSHTLGAGYENKHLWLYKDNGGAYGTTEFRPLTGITRNDADKWGLETPNDPSLRTTMLHSDYQSSTGVVSASGNVASYDPWHAFDADNEVVAVGTYWSIATITNSWIQYKFNEPRVLKSWRMKHGGAVGTEPQRFTVEGSNDGLTWTTVDGTYTSSDYTSPGVNLWGSLHSTSGNSTAYQYVRMNITQNGTHATNTEIGQLEFNTILPSDYYLVNEGKIYNPFNTAIERVYLAELRTGGDGEIIWYRNLPVGKQSLNEIELQGDLIVHGDIEHWSNATAIVVFDASTSPPTIKYSKGIADVVDRAVGRFTLVYEKELDHKHVIITGSSSASSWFGGVDLDNNGNNNTINSTEIVLHQDSNAGAYIDPTLVTVAIFGGKS